MISFALGLKSDTVLVSAMGEPTFAAEMIEGAAAREPKRREDFILMLKVWLRGLVNVVWKRGVVVECPRKLVCRY